GLEASGAANPVLPSSGWLRGPILRWGGLAASVAVVTVAVTLPKLSRHSLHVSTTQSAQTDSKRKPEARAEELTDKLGPSAAPSYRAVDVDSVAAQSKRAESSNRKQIDVTVN